jgi:molecular chaperone HtpG
MSQNFQVDLRAIIELLSNNLYSGPQVFIRELIQNSIDAIRARQALEPGFDGRIEMELSGTPESGRILMVEDNGIGLTEEEVRLFLATIGSSSKRETVTQRRGDYIGQFGIGLLSCFIVTEEIVLVTRSAKDGAVAVEWRGKGDGSYALRPLESKVAAGTKIYLRAAPGREKYFEFERLLGFARNYAGLLSVPISLREGERREMINIPAPWRESFASEQVKSERFAAFGAEIFQSDFFDFIPLRDEALGIDGVAYVLPFAPGPSARAVHRLHLKDMLISDEADNFVPEWAFFVRCALNARDLTPTASRESVMDNEALAAVRESIGRQLKQYVQQLVKFDERRLAKFLQLHALAIKHLATFDDDILLMFAEHLPFETNFGVLTLAACRRQTDEVFAVADVDEFRQVAEVAAAQGMLVLNAGYVFDMPILERYAALRPGRATQPLSLTKFASRLRDITLKERETFFELIEKAGRILQRFQVRPEVRHFQPESLPVMYVASRAALSQRAVEEVKRVSSGPWGDILGSISSRGADEKPELCLNASSSLIQQLALRAKACSVDDLKEIVEVLYVQSLLFSRRSLRPEEMTALNDGILRLTQTHLDQL